MWEEMRRALARLFAHATVRELPAARMAVGVSVRASGATGLPEITAGAREGEWRPRTDTISLPPPQASEGGGGADLATVATIIGSDAALRQADCPVYSISAVVEGGAVRAWDGTGVVARGVSHDAPVTVSLPGTRPAALLASRVELRHDQGLLTLRGGRPVSALARLADVPMTRMRRVSDAGFVAERAHLAAVSGAPVADVALVGVFPHVPLAAVRHLAVAEGGEGLRIWLKADALGPKRTPGPKLVTVVLGRQRSTGRTLQAVMPAAPPKS